MYNVHLVSEALTSIGRPPAKLENMRSLLEAAGFVDIHTRSIKQPVGPWPKDQRQKQIGAMNLLSMETGIEAYSLATLTRIKGMSKEEVARICRDSWNAVKNKNFHVYGYLWGLLI